MYQQTLLKLFCSCAYVISFSKIKGFSQGLKIMCLWGLWQVNNAANYVASGTGQLKTAKNHQRNTRKWVCIGIILLLLLILLVVVPVAKSIHDAEVAASSGH
jgi:hypothetical protein